ncbi:hypothetical protein [Tomitella biformata]|uniref:hypothetical protein n=1 Tax=Tomitella biformata TaxID=630403 RepID=UPI000465368B|nr:hypothetical protein [Tomitella biformata]
MRFSGIKRAATGIAASIAMVGGLALAAPTTAAAAPSYEGPGMTAEQGDFGGKNVQVKVTNPNIVSGYLDATACSPVLLEGEAAIRALLAFEADDYGELFKIITSKDVRTGNLAINYFLKKGPNSSTTDWDVADGVYLLAGLCVGGNTLSDPSGAGFTLQPLIVPSGIGSISPALAFGSVVLESGDELGGLLPKLIQSPLLQGMVQGMFEDMVGGLN